FAAPPRSPLPERRAHLDQADRVAARLRGAGGVQSRLQTVDRNVTQSGKKPADLTSTWARGRLAEITTSASHRRPSLVSRIPVLGPHNDSRLIKFLAGNIKRRAPRRPTSPA